MTLAIRRHKLKRRRGALPGRAPQNMEPVPTWSTLVDFLVREGCDRTQVIEGSMPEESLQNICKFLHGQTDGWPIKGLHIGNFVGVSLAYLTRWMIEANSESCMVSIDPNIPHRGITDPMRHVISLLNHLEAQGNSIILTGYSLHKSIGNDGISFGGYEPMERFHQERSCENQLRQLAALCPASFDFVLIDGNHEGKYFAEEITQVSKLLRPGGFLIADDIRDAWFDIRDVYDRLLDTQYVEFFRDGRIGIVQKTALQG